MTAAGLSDAALRAGTAIVKPAAAASRWNILHRLERILVEILADQRQLGEHVVGDGDDVAADLVGLEDVEQLARAGPEQLGLRAVAQDARSDSRISGTGSRPVSAMRPAKTETIAGTFGVEAFGDRARPARRS